MKVSFKIAECSLLGAKINKKHETRKRFRAYYMYFGVTYMKTKTNFIPWMTAAHAQTSKIQSL